MLVLLIVSLSRPIGPRYLDSIMPPPRSILTDDDDHDDDDDDIVGLTALLIHSHALQLVHELH